MSIKKNLLFIAFVLILWIPWNTGPTYVVFSVYMLIFLCQHGIKAFLINSKKEDFIARSFVLVWLYGLILGFMMGNKTSYVIANFAGIVCYLWYFILVKKKPNIDRLIKLILIGGCVHAIYVIVQFVSFLNGTILNLGPLFGGEGDMGSTGQLRFYSASLCVAYVLFACTFSMLIFKNKSYDYMKRPFIWFVVSTFALVIASASKGLMLGVLYVVGVITLYYAFNLIRGRFQRKGLVFLLLIPMVYFFLEEFEYINIIYEIFDQDDSSNVERYDQLTYMLDDLSFWGRGLGSLIPGSTRSVMAPYGYELSYINVLHKFGFMSLFLFGGWIYMFKKSIKNYILKRDNKYALVVFSSMGYMFPSIGNPLLFGPTLVVLQATSLYILRNID